MSTPPAETVRVILSRDEAEDLCWAYAGYEPAQASELTNDALNKFRLAARWPVQDREPADNQIAVDLPRAEAQALGFDSDDSLIGPALRRIEEAL